MSVEITTTSGISVTVTTPTNSSISVTSKGPKGDTGADSTVAGPTGPAGADGADGTSFTAGDGLDLTGTSLTADLKYQGGLTINSGELQVNLSDPQTAGSLPVTKGGTGVASHTSGGVLIGNGAGSINAVDLTSNGNIIVGGATPAAVAASNLAGSGLAATTGDGTLVLAVETLNQDTTGNAATATLAADATTLATPRAINGVNFDGSGPITVPAAGSTLTDTVTVANGGTGLTTVGANQILTGNATGALTSEANLTFGVDRLHIGTDDEITPQIRLQNDENTVTIGVSDSVDNIMTGSADGDLIINSSEDKNVLFGQNNAVAAKIDTDGVFTSKTFSYISCGYFDDISTTLHYLPLNGPPNEYTTEGNAYTDWVAPCAVTVLSAQMRFSSLSGSDGNLTMTVWKDPIGSGTKASVEAETVAVTTTDDNDVVHFLFDGASIAKGEAMKISIQADADVTGSSNTFVTIVLLMDWADRYTVSSAVIAS